MKIQSRNEKSRCESEKENTQLFLESIPVEKKTLHHNSTQQRSYRSTGYINTVNGAVRFGSCLNMRFKRN